MTKQTSYEQVQSASWDEPGHAGGWIKLSPEALTTRSPLAFVHGADDLDTFAAATLRLPSGRLVVLVARPVADYGIDVYVAPSDSHEGAMTELAAALGLARTEFTTL